MRRDSVLVVGSGTRFLSGISYYTHRLASELAQDHKVTVVLMRALVPKRLYPGRARVGAEITDLTYPEGTTVVDGVDYTWRGVVQACRAIWRDRPRMAVFQWWTATVGHTYVLLSLVARLRGARIVLEMHETLDSAEQRIPAVAVYARFIRRLLSAVAHAFVVHSEADVSPAREAFGPGQKPVVVIPHGPYDHHLAEGRRPTRERRDTGDAIRILFFGTVRPYKGLEDLITAFNALSAPLAADYELTVAGETWEGHQLPAQLIAQSPHGGRIRFLNRYLTDAELDAELERTDVVALPYRRSSASGPMHIAMACGLPMIITDLPALREAARGYDGAVFVPPEDSAALSRALTDVRALVGCHFRDPCDWRQTRSRFAGLFRSLDRETSPLPQPQDA
jgi:glycosyltransferase involved in cell wall biosynthesis